MGICSNTFFNIGVSCYCAYSSANERIKNNLYTCHTQQLTIILW